MVTVDMHLNLAGSGTGLSGCYISDKFLKRYTIRFLRAMYKISDKQLRESIDQDWARLTNKVVSESPVDYGVVLGFDHIYDPRSGQQRLDRTQMVVPMDWVFRVCEEHRQLLPGPGINPYRPDALERLSEANDRGAVLIKWLPPAQGVDPTDRTLIPFYKKLVDYKIPLLVHTAAERTFASIDPNLGDIWRLRLPLDCGVTVIAAHAATSIFLSRDIDQVPTLLRMLSDYPNLWVDNSGLCNPGRFANLQRIALEPLIHERTLYGSDWPIPVNAFYFVHSLGFKKVWDLEKIANPIARDIEIKRAFGFSDSTLSRAATLLSHLDRWTGKHLQRRD